MTARYRTAEASIADVAVCLVAALVFLGLTISRGA
jgi:hypothetical protein